MTLLPSNTRSDQIISCTSDSAQIAELRRPGVAKFWTEISLISIRKYSFDWLPRWPLTPWQSYHKVPVHTVTELIILGDVLVAATQYCRNKDWIQENSVLLNLVLSNSQGTFSSGSNDLIGNREKPWQTNIWAPRMSAVSTMPVMKDAVHQISLTWHAPPWFREFSFIGNVQDTSFQ